MKWELEIHKKKYSHLSTTVYVFTFINRIATRDRDIRYVSIVTHDNVDYIG